MEFKFSRPYLSIVGFPDTTFPKFTLITGPNGAGKSHLLRAIKDGHIKAAQANAPSDEVRLFDWTQFIPQDSGVFDSSTLVNETQNLFQNFHQQQENTKQSIIVAANAIGIPQKFLADTAALLRLKPADFLEIFADQNKADAAHQAIKRAADQAGAKLLRHLDQKQRSHISETAERAGVSLMALTRDDFIGNRMISWGQADLFKNAIGRMFVAYRDLSLQNKLAQLQQSKGHQAFCLTDDEFTAKHMVAPWIFMNDALKTAGLDFTITIPNELVYGNYEPRLRKISNHAEIKFNDLSSGEKVLMSLALCLYYAEDKRQLATYPKILLLDEVDAPLHPAMSRTLIDTITKTLVGKHDIDVIATTHSPSTVALAPDESLHVMEPEKAGVHKTTKSSALNLLTVGVPTLALSYEGRRQVFVESPYDAFLYDRLYQLTKLRLKSERSLEFIPTSAKPVSGAQANTGCDTVRRIVADLVKAGNSSVFGLLDWDGKSTPDGRLLILAHGRRNGLENVVLDPLVITCLLLRNDANAWQTLGLAADTTYLQFTKMGAANMQTVVDRLQKIVLGRDVNGETKMKATYVGGLSLELDSEYLQMDDHKLEERLLNALPSLKSVSRGKTGELMKQTVEQVLREMPDYIPSEIPDIFEKLLGADSHITQPEAI